MRLENSGMKIKFQFSFFLFCGLGKIILKITKTQMVTNVTMEKEKHYTTAQ